ncbi:hypothetical protein Tco_0936708 [Tanacetum coccineum]|uniref:Uncharacterized protein n=1 Tax=Tanacetum coccineum TaxID=301880 RepID=A0ABQ5DE40_9ASTR
MQWLADKFKIHEELDPLTMDGLRDYWKKVVNGNEISEYEENTNEEFDNQDTPYALWNEQDHAEQSSSHECHALDPPEAAYYNKSDDPDEEYIARRLQIVKKVTMYTLPQLMSSEMEPSIPYKVMSNLNVLGLRVIDRILDYTYGTLIVNMDFGGHEVKAIIHHLILYP